MQINFAGTPIAREPSDGGTDAVTGFVPKGTQNMRWRQPIRATDATPVARGNRKQTLTGTIWLAPSDTLGDAMLLRGLMFTQLPRTGALVFSIGALRLTYQFAVLSSFDTVNNAKGVACAYQVSFAVGPGMQTDLALVTGAGKGLVTGDGKQLVI